MPISSHHSHSRETQEAAKLGYRIANFRVDSNMGNPDSAYLTRIVRIEKHSDSFQITISSWGLACIGFEPALELRGKDTINIIADPFGLGCFRSCNYLLHYTLIGSCASKTFLFNTKPIEIGPLAYKVYNIEYLYHPNQNVKTETLIHGDEIIRIRYYDENGKLIKVEYP